MTRNKTERQTVTVTDFPLVPPIGHTTIGGFRDRLRDCATGHTSVTVGHTGHGQKADRFQGGRIGNERARWLAPGNQLARFGLAGPPIVHVH